MEATADSGGVRLAHFSDIHVTTDCRWALRDWLSKRLTSWINLRLLGRGRRFGYAERVVQALVRDLRQRGCEHILFSGDATSLGFEEEVAWAAELLGVGKPDMPPGLAVPGNHDYCTRASVAGGYFERYFAPWLAGERIDGAVYPFAQRAGPVRLIAVNSSTANRFPWDASGAVGRDQLDRLEALLNRLPAGPRILITHYPVLLASGNREWRSRELRDLDDLLAIARRGNISLWLHGHRHSPFFHAASEDVPFPVVCAGSATQRGLWSYGEYTLTSSRLQAMRRVYDKARECFVEGDSFEVELPSNSRSGSTPAGLSGR
jgi:3',5'-cyclic AMP phosphodiesterase CpdA